LAVQAEYPHRRAPLLRQAFIAALTVGLDGVACWFAAQALGNGQTETLLWAVLFLAVLAGGEITLDYYSERGGHAWRLLVTCLAIFVAGLVVLC
jgi:MFS family permease